jgi:cytochrome oxidase Cu insertion factor (SCO1/SenC/PrrC family)
MVIEGTVAMGQGTNNEARADNMKWHLPHVLSAILFALAALAPHPVWPAPFSLYNVPNSFVDDKNETVHLSDWRGKPLILTMEHSTCRFSCSISVSKLKAIQALADQKNIKIDFMIISIDPRNDTPETWRQFRESRDEERSNWHLLTGNEATTNQIANMLGIKYWYMEDHVLHDFKILRLNANGEIEKTITDYDDDAAALLM